MGNKSYVRGYIHFHGKTYEMNDALLEEVMEELVSMGVKKEDVLITDLKEATMRVLSKKHNKTLGQTP